VHFKCIAAPIAQAILLLSRMRHPKPCATHALPNPSPRDKPPKVALDKRPVFAFSAGMVTFVLERSVQLVGEVGHGNFLADTSITHLFDPNVPQDKRRKEYADLRNCLCARSNYLGWSRRSMRCPDQLGVRGRTVHERQTSSSFGIIVQHRRSISSRLATWAKTA